LEFWTRLEEVRKAHDVLEHPFYARWSAGELSGEDLAIYAGQYRHAVVALAAASERVAELADGAEREELTAHAREEEAHISLWDRFATATGGDPAASPAPGTAACAAAWEGERRDLLGHLVALYAIESAQPAISHVKADGLRELYGFGDNEDATAYFDLHAERDVAHAASERELIEPRLTGADHEALLIEAEAVLRANWQLLDAVEQLCAD
jgi:pyrroloquinoline quinone (PQQ) biosynthesis protein C